MKIKTCQMKDISLTGKKWQKILFLSWVGKKCKKSGKGSSGWTKEVPCSCRQAVKIMRILTCGDSEPSLRVSRHLHTLRAEASTLSRTPPILSSLSRIIWIRDSKSRITKFKIVINITNLKISRLIWVLEETCKLRMWLWPHHRIEMLTIFNHLLTLIASGNQVTIRDEFNYSQANIRIL